MSLPCLPKWIVRSGRKTTAALSSEALPFATRVSLGEKTGKRQGSENEVARGKESDRANGNRSERAREREPRERG